MSRKVVSWALILAMLFGMFSTPLFAASQISLDKTTYAVGERVRVTVSGATQEMVDDEAFVAIYEEGAAHNSWMNYEYIKKTGTNTLDFTAPSKKGTYEMRVYIMNGTYTDATMAAKTTFTVGTVAAPSSNIKLTPDKALYAAGERVRVTVGGVSEEMVDDEAFITIHEEDAAHKSWLSYNYVKRVGTNTVDFAAPSKKGVYEIRFYSMDGFYSDATMLTKTTVNVGTIPAPTSSVKLAPEKATYAGGEVMKITVSGVTEEMVDDEAFIAIYEEDAAHKSWQNYVFVKKVGTSTVELKAPSKKGIYELRFYSMDDYYSDATMLTKSLIGVEMTPPATTEQPKPQVSETAKPAEPSTSQPPTQSQSETISFEALIRDFKADRILFENHSVQLAHRKNLVSDKLGANKKPVLNAQLWFDTWSGTTETMLDTLFNNIEGINMPTTKPIVLSDNGKGYFVLDAKTGNGGYFPIDNELFGNETNNHNYHFTLEAHGKFTYQGFEEFEFQGDDDVWVFVDNTLIIDIGGVHTPVTEKVSLPNLVTQGILNIQVGQEVDLDFFFMERRTTQSNLYIQTNINFTNNPVAVPSTPPTTQPTQPSQPTQPTQPSIQVPSLTVVAVDSGVKLSWTPVTGALGYRVYRSTKQGVEGLSITDFAMNTTTCVDVNVDANTTYYYVLRVLLKEATVSGDRELLSMPSNEINIKTGATILGGNASDSGGKTKNVVLMKLDDPNMSYNGIKQEIDPGRGTTPQLINGRTFMPIRAVIEAMGGKIGWEDATSKITLEAGGHSVTMWLNKKDLVVDGANKEMDVAPASVNGRTMVPVRFAAENVGCVVDWLSSTSEIVVVFYGGSTIPPVTQLPITDLSKPVETKPSVVEPPVTQPPTPPVTQPPTGSTTPPAKTEPSKPIVIASANPDPVNDPISTKALIGSWQMFLSASPLSAAETVIFREDGSFDIYYFLSVSSSYTGWDGYRRSYSASASQSFAKGNFRVSGNSIEFFNVERANGSAFSSGWEHEQSRTDAFDKLRNLPESYYTSAGNFVWLFEFYDANNLRLINDTGGDWDFKWDESVAHNVQIPTHMLPEPNWPTTNISPHMPQFAGKGRLREVGYYYPEEKEDDEYRAYFITIYRTNREAALAYAQSLKNAGWLVSSPDFDPSARKGLYYLNIYAWDNYFTIIYNKDRQGVWPVEWFGTAVTPPSGSEIIGEINTSYWEKQKSFSLSVDCAGVDSAALERYFNQLRNDGFADSEDSYSTKLYKFARINGDMFRIWVESYKTELDISTINYFMEYFENASWPAANKMPPGFVAPDGVELLEEIKIYEGWNGGGNFEFYFRSTDKAAIDKYFAKLESNGWKKDEESYSALEKRTAQIKWNGTLYDCEIEFYGTDDGLTTFNASFYPAD